MQKWEGIEGDAALPALKRRLCVAAVVRILSMGHLDADDLLQALPEDLKSKVEEGLSKVR